MLHVIAMIELHPDSRQLFLKEFHRIVPTVRDEAGCIEYGPAVDAATEIPAQTPLGPDTVSVIEKWESVAALEAHLAAPHMAAYRERVRDFVRSVRLHILQPA
jgi:quinol monooxygenase YgiN